MELWDLYTKNRVKTMGTHIRGHALPKDRYHLVVNVWIKNSDGKIFNDILDVRLFEYNGEINLKNATTDEVKDARWMTVDEIYELCSKGLIVSTLIEPFDRIVSYTKEGKSWKI